MFNTNEFLFWFFVLSLFIASLSTTNRIYLNQLNLLIHLIYIQTETTRERFIFSWMVAHLIKTHNTIRYLMDAVRTYTNGRQIEKIVSRQRHIWAHQLFISSSISNCIEIKCFILLLWRPMQNDIEKSVATNVRSFVWISFEGILFNCCCHASFSHVNSPQGTRNETNYMQKMWTILGARYFCRIKFWRW